MLIIYHEAYNNTYIKNFYCILLVSSYNISSFKLRALSQLQFHFISLHQFQSEIVPIERSLTADLQFL